MDTLIVKQYAEQHSSPEPELLRELRLYTEKNVSNPQMLSGPIGGALLKWLVGLTRATRVLELGTYTGYSALFMAEALPENGYLLSCDRSAEAQAVAQMFIDKSAHKNKIQLVNGLVPEFLEGLIAKKELFDFIFIDADKKPYPSYVESTLKLLSPNGMIAVDNTLFMGEVLDPQSETSKIINQLNHELSQRQDLDVLFLPLRDGVTLIRRKV